jgi:hypothetical protein
MWVDLYHCWHYSANKSWCSRFVALTLSLLNTLFFLKLNSCKNGPALLDWSMSLVMYNSLVPCRRFLLSQLVPYLSRCLVIGQYSVVGHVFKVHSVVGDLVVIHTWGQCYQLQTFCCDLWDPIVSWIKFTNYGRNHRYK